MPPKASWITHIPEMIAAVSALNVPVLDRASFECLFRVRRRRAISLMKYFGGYHAGSSILVDREAFLKRLERLQEDPATGYEVHRKRQLADHLAATKRTRLGMKIKYRCRKMPEIVSFKIFRTASKSCPDESSSPSSQRNNSFRSCTTFPKPPPTTLIASVRPLIDRHTPRLTACKIDPGHRRQRSMARTSVPAHQTPSRGSLLQRG